MILCVECNFATMHKRVIHVVYNASMHFYTRVFEHYILEKSIDNDIALHHFFTSPISAALVSSGTLANETNEMLVSSSNT